MLEGKIAGRPQWLITKHTTRRMEVFTTHLCGDRKALAIFSFEEEAQMFLDLYLAASKDGWRVRQTSAGELVSVLYGPCSDTKKVVLDPVPRIGRKEIAGLLSMHRNDFVGFLLKEEVPLNIHLVSSHTHRPQELLEYGHLA